MHILFSVCYTRNVCNSAFGIYAAAITMKGDSIMAIEDFKEKISGLSGLDDAITNFARKMEPINQPPSI